MKNTKKVFVSECDCGWRIEGDDAEIVAERAMEHMDSAGVDHHTNPPWRMEK